MNPQSNSSPQQKNRKVPPLLISSIPLKTQRNRELTVNLQSLDHQQTSREKRQPHFLSGQSIQRIRQLLRGSGKETLFEVFMQMIKLQNNCQTEVILERVDILIGEYVDQQYNVNEILDSLGRLKKSFNEIQVKSSTNSERQNQTPIKSLNDYKIEEQKLSTIQQSQTTKSFLPFIDGLYSDFKRTLKIAVNWMTLAVAPTKQKKKYDRVHEFHNWYREFYVPKQKSIESLSQFVNACTNRLSLTSQCILKKKLT